MAQAPPAHIVGVDPITGNVHLSSGQWVGPGQSGQYMQQRVPAVKGPAPGGIVQNPALAGTRIGQAIAGTSPVHRPLAAGSPDTSAIQHFLVSQGYNIPVDGVMGRLTKAAISDFHMAPKVRNPKGFNQKYGLANGGKPKSVVIKPIKQLISKNGQMSPGYAASAATDPSGAPTVDVSGLQALAHLASSTGVKIPPSLLSKLTGKTSTPISMDALNGISGNTSNLVPESAADDIAGLQYDPQIHDLGAQRDRLDVQAPENQRDIGDYYDQVLGAQSKATARDSAATAAGQGSLQDAFKSIVASLGGSANAGSGLVGAAGADALGTLGAVGTAEDQYNSDIVPLLRASAADAKTQQGARDTASRNDLTGQLIDAIGARGQAKGAALMDIRNQNNQSRQQDYSNELGLANAKLGVDQANQQMSQQDFENGMNLLSTKLGITQSNNQLGQQRFQNKLALEQAKEAAAVSGAKIIGSLTPKAVRPGSNLPKGSFANATAAQKSTVAKTIAQTLFDATGKLKPGMSPNHARSLALGIIRQAGWHPQANVETQHWAQSVLQSLGI